MILFIGLIIPLSLAFVHHRDWQARYEEAKTLGIPINIGVLDYIALITTIGMIAWGIYVMSWWLVLIGFFVSPFLARLIEAFIPMGAGAPSSIVAAILVWLLHYPF